PIHSLLIHDGVLRHATALGEQALIERVRINIGVLLMEDDPKAGAAVGNEGLEDAMRRGSLSIAAFFASNASEAEMKVGDWARVRDRMLRLLDLGPEAVDREIVLQTLALIDVLQGTSDLVTRAELAGSLVEANLLIAEALVAGDGASAARMAIEAGAEDSLNAMPSYLLAAMGAAMARDAALADEAASRCVALGRHGRWVEAL